MTNPDTSAVEFLRKVPLFAGLTDDDLYKLCEVVEKVSVKAGKFLFKQDDQGDRAYVVIDGELEVLRHQEGRDVLLAVQGSGVVIGEMALVEDRPRYASIRARLDTELYAIWKEDLDGLLSSSPTAMKSMFHTIVSRLRENRVQMRQGERMAQLGTLTAGVAHELNNPAAAVKRGATELRPALDALQRTIEHFPHMGLDNDQHAKLHRLLDEARARTLDPLAMDALTQSDREYELETWLDDHRIEDAWQLAPSLTQLGYDAARLDQLLGIFSGDEQLGNVLQAVERTYTAYFLIGEINAGASQISAIVKALKSYSFLDQAPMQLIDIHEGLNSTLLIMRNKLKQGIEVSKDYAPDLPRIMAYGSELNQVWTNLIDNAADALTDAATESAEIVLRTRRDSDWIVVDVQDNGPGISEANQQKVFDAFFTTKAPGKGTGMGLDISYKIVVEKHRGDIKLRSKPGETVFSVWLPVTTEAPQSSS